MPKVTIWVKEKDWDKFLSKERAEWLTEVINSTDSKGNFLGDDKE